LQPPSRAGPSTAERCVEARPWPKGHQKTARAVPGASLARPATRTTARAPATRPGYSGRALSQRHLPQNNQLNPAKRTERQRGKYPKQHRQNNGYHRRPEQPATGFQPPPSALLWPRPALGCKPQPVQNRLNVNIGNLTARLLYGTYTVTSLLQPSDTPLPR